MNPDDIVSIQVSIKELQYIVVGLQELPAKIANPLTNKINQQLNEQVNKEQ